MYAEGFFGVLRSVTVYNYNSKLFYYYTLFAKSFNKIITSIRMMIVITWQRNGISGQFIDRRVKKINES